MVELKLEVVVIPVSDVDRAKRFYEKLGFRLDIDYAANENYRVLQFTPPGSGASIIFGKGVTSAKPGSIDRLVLAVSDIVAASSELIARGAVVKMFHDAGGGVGAGFVADTKARAPGPDPQRRSYASYASFSDPDGNVWLLQEITARLPGRVEAGDTIFKSRTELAAALRRAEAAHGEHEQRTGGQRDADWPSWYAEYMIAEQAGKPLPT